MLALSSASELARTVVVGIADLAVSDNQNVGLTIYPLGSCLGVAIYDPVARVGGLIHLMLPDSAIDPVKAGLLPAMFVDTGMPALFQSVYALQAQKDRLQIFVAGGAQVMDSSDCYNIGQRNLDALTSLLEKLELHFESAEVGSTVNRRMQLQIATGEVTFKVSSQRKERPLCKG